MIGMNSDRDLDSSNTDLRNTAIIDSELSRWKVSIAALQETRFAGAGSIKEEHYTFFWYGKALEKHRIYGNAFAVLNNLLSTTQTQYAVNDRRSALKLNSQQWGIIIINAYAPALAVDDKAVLHPVGKYCQTVVRFWTGNPSWRYEC